MGNEPPDSRTHPAATMTLRELHDTTGCDIDALIEFCFSGAECWELGPLPGLDEQPLTGAVVQLPSHACGGGSSR